MTESVIALVQPIFFTRNKHKSLIQQEQAIECNYFFFFQHSKSVFLTIILPPKLLFSPLAFLQSCHTYLSPVFLVLSACFSPGCSLSALFIRSLGSWDCFLEIWGCWDLLSVFVVAIPLCQLLLNTCCHVTVLIYLKRQWLSRPVISVRSVIVSKSKSSGLRSSYDM